MSIQCLFIDMIMTIGANTRHFLFYLMFIQFALYVLQHNHYLPYSHTPNLGMLLHLKMFLFGTLRKDLVIWIQCVLHHVLQ